MYRTHTVGNNILRAHLDPITGLLAQSNRVSPSTAPLIETNMERCYKKGISLKVLPTGGWTNTITMAFDVVSSRLLLKDTKIIVVLDKDIKGFVPGFLGNNPQYRNVRINYLPISSLEKYLKKGLIDSFDIELFEKLDTYLFQKKPLTSLIQESLY